MNQQSQQTKRLEGLSWSLGTCDQLPLGELGGVGQGLGARTKVSCSGLVHASAANLWSFSLSTCKMGQQERPLIQQQQEKQFAGCWEEGGTI